MEAPKITDDPQDGWKEEAMQLRDNFRNNSAAIAAFMGLLEAEIDRVDSPLLCLAIHHIAMDFHALTGKKTLRKMLESDLRHLPEAIYPADRIGDTYKHEKEKKEKTCKAK